MAKLQRITGKIFGSTASATGTDPEIGQFGSAKAGTYVGTGDVETIQSLPAWNNGWIDAVTPTQQYPTLPEMTGVHKVLSHQYSYILQHGVPEWDEDTDYYTNDFCSRNDKIYYSLIDGNIGFDPALPESLYMWKEYGSQNNRTYVPFCINSGNVDVNGEADLIVQPDVINIKESQINEVQQIAGRSHPVNTEDLYQSVEIHGNIFGAEVGTGRYVSSNIYVNKISGETGQPYGATSHTYTFGTPLDAGTYRILFCKMNGYSSSYTLYATIDGVEQQITVPSDSTLSTSEWTESSDITVTTSLSQLRVNTSQASGTCVPAIRLLKLISRGTTNTLYFNVGGLYPNVVATNADGFTFGTNSIPDRTLSSTPYTEIENYKNILLGDNFEAETALENITTQIESGYSSILLRQQNGGQTPYIKIHGDTAFKLKKWSFSNQYNQVQNGYSPTSWTVSGSNDGTTWTQIDTFSAGSVEGESFVWNVNSSTAYTYYRFSGAGQSGGDSDSILSINFNYFTADYEVTRTDSDDGVFNILLNADGAISVYENTIYKCKNTPAGNVNDIWLNTSVAFYDAYRFNGTSWQKYEGVPLGYCVRTAGYITDVKTFPYNEGAEEKAEIYPVIETYQNGTSWYRIYSDGWCEMGGYTTSSSSNTQQTVNFLKTFADTNYNISATQAFYSSAYNANLTIVSNTTSSMIVLGQQTGFYWQASGYLAEGEY